MNIKPFLTEALSQALDLGIGTPTDVIQHVTPDVLAAYLPKPLWARLLTACMGAARVDAQLIVETIGIPNLCEHVPTTIMWQCITEIATRSLGQPYIAPEAARRELRAQFKAASTPPANTASALAPTPGTSSSSSVLAPPPAAIEAPAVMGTSPGASVGPKIPAPVNEPLADLISELESDDRPITPTRARTPTSQRFRQSNTGIGRLGQQSAAVRRPQAQAVATPIAAAPVSSASRSPRRTGTEVEDVETDPLANLRPAELAVDDSQLVDWQTETTEPRPADDDFSDLGRKRRE